MKVNLKKAAGLAAAVLAAVPKFSHQFTVDIFADPVSPERLQELNEQLVEQVATTNRLVDVAFFIRDLVGKANAEHGVNELLTSRALIEKKLELFNNIPVRQENPNLIALERQVEASRATNPQPAYGRGGGLTLDLETASIVSPELAALRRAKRKVEEELATANYNTTIELPKDVVEVLEGLDLV